MTTNVNFVYYRILLHLLLYINLFSSSACDAPYKFFSTKTPYEWVHQSLDLEQVEDQLYHMKDLQGMSCTAVHASAVIRHGARYPGLEDVHDISRVHEKLVEAMEPNVNSDLYNWANKFPSNNDKALSHLGEMEQEALGRRIAKKLTTLFAEEDLGNFRFIVSSKERTKQSASAFFEGFASVVYGSEDSEDEFDSEVNDEVLRFFNLCANYVFSVENNKTAFSHYYTFLSSEKLVNIQAKMEQKLGIKSGTLTTANVRLIYLMCGYETAVYKTSPWCSLLDEDDMEVLEYLGDLKHYYKNGFGYNITWEQSCPLVSEIFSSMDETILEIESSDDGDDEVDGYLVGQFAFGHAETLGPLYAALGLFNDSEPLRSDNYEGHQQRKFRTSQILPFSANLMFVLYECVLESEQQQHETAAAEFEEADYYLKLFVNEKPTLIPGCQQFHCSYNIVRDHYSRMVDHCNFKKLCKKPDTRDEL